MRGLWDIHVLLHLQGSLYYIYLQHPEKSLFSRKKLTGMQLPIMRSDITVNVQSYDTESIIVPIIWAKKLKNTCTVVKPSKMDLASFACSSIQYETAPIMWSVSSVNTQKTQTR